VFVTSYWQKLEPFFDAEVGLRVEHANETEQKVVSAEQQIELIQQRARSHSTGRVMLSQTHLDYVSLR